jgi:pilus assembly protein Flp/PilA
MLNNLTTHLAVKAQSIAHRFSREETGATAVEYGLIVGLIAVVIIGVVATLGGTLSGFFTSINNTLAQHAPVGG